MLPGPEFAAKVLWQFVQLFSPGDPVAPAFPLSESTPAKNNTPADPNANAKW